MRLLSIGLLCLFLAGCAAAKDDVKCRSYGASPGDFGVCPVPSYA